MVKGYLSNVHFSKRTFSLCGKREGGRESYDNSHVPNLGGKLKSVSVCTRDIVDVYREEKVVTSRCHCSNISGCQQTKTSLKMWIRTVSNFIELT